MSGSHSRSKGVRGEREVADIFEAAGWSVRGLEMQGDWLAVRPADEQKFHVLHIECKRRERLQINAWLLQAESEAPEGVTPVVCFRRNGEKWRAIFPLEALVNFG